MWNLVLVNLELCYYWCKIVHGLRQTYHKVRNHFGCTRWYSYLTRLKWKLVSVCLDIVLILTQDSCSVCNDRTVGSKIVLDTRMMELLGDVGHVESRFGPFRDKVSVEAR
jgi:hypothetical protein